jgi:hypothetical protein
LALQTIEQVEIILEIDLGGARVLGDARTCELGGEDLICLADSFQSLPSFSTWRTMVKPLFTVFSRPLFWTDKIAVSLPTIFFVWLTFTLNSQLKGPVRLIRTIITVIKIVVN